jgi:hypothetical protein
MALVVQLLVVFTKCTSINGCNLQKEAAPGILKTMIRALVRRNKLEETIKDGIRLS